MAFDAFLQLAGVKGESTVKGFEGAIEIFSFSFGASNPVNVAGGGAGAGKVSISDFSIMKKTDVASNDMFAKCCTGEHFDSGTVSLRKAGGEQMIYLKYEFKEVFVSSIQWSGSSGGDDVPTESVSFAFKEVKITYQLQDKKGAATKPSVYGWNVAGVHKV